MKLFPKVFFLFCFLSIQMLIFAQTATVKGRVSDTNNRPMISASLQVLGTDIHAETDENGLYSVVIPVTSPKMCKIQFEYAGYESTILELEIRENYVYDKPVSMRSLELKSVDITAKSNANSQIQTIKLKSSEMMKMPTFNPSVEAILQSLGGVAANNEFSSQYRVRGGNFDENLVYVNGIEIYRPFLARQGQMEGLGFANRSLVDNISFSTGGFPAQYGDKLSSVLDVTYRTPKENKGSVEAGLITNSVHLEGVSKNQKFTYLTGARMFTLSYLLNSLETKGDYKPFFADLQGMFTYTPIRGYRAPQIRTLKDGTLDTLYYAPERLKFTAFVTGARNRFLFTPVGEETTLGTFNQAFRVRTGFEGREVSTYTTLVGSLMAEHRPTPRLKFQHIFSSFQTEEAEKSDVEGGYVLSEVNTQFGTEEFGKDDYTLGTGSLFRSARNYLTIKVLALETKGEWVNIKKKTFRHKLYWGAKAEIHLINDEIKEYNLYDSAQYVVIPTTNGNFNVSEYVKGSVNFQRQMYRAYFQHEWKIDKAEAATLTSGVRATYDDKIQKLMISPRIQFVYDFSKVRKDLNLKFRLATGVYHQPPFYREFRNHEGVPVFSVQPQTSIHFIAGTDYTFRAWGRDFILFSELYYKKLYNLIPYEIQNVRIRYYPEVQVKGFAYGWDTRLNGQFIKGIDSWISFSLLKTMEQQNVGGTYIPRPTDQRFTVSLYFQDELPINPTYKVHVNFIYGSGMRFGAPNSFDNRTYYPYPAYQRMDIGFSKMILFRTSDEMAVRKHGFSSLWATVEVFNLFQRANTVSYNWIKDFDNHQFAIPNHLSARLLNFRLVAHFK